MLVSINLHDATFRLLWLIEIISPMGTITPLQKKSTQKDDVFKELCPKTTGNNVEKVSFVFI